METGSQIGPYLIVSRLGSGGMGDVYRTRDLVLDREVAVKALPASMKGDRSASPASSARPGCSLP